MAELKRDRAAQARCAPLPLVGRGWGWGLSSIHACDNTPPRLPSLRLAGDPPHKGEGKGRVLKRSAAETSAETTIESGYGSSRIGSPAAAMWALAWPMVDSPKWKIEAASTAVAWPSRMPSTR